MSVDSSWWRQPDLTRIWGLIADRLEREGLQPHGRVTAAQLTRPEQRALSDLLGRSVLRERERVDLPVLDGRLRSRAGIGVVEAAGSVLGRELSDRPAERAAQAARRNEPVTAFEEWIARHPELKDWALDEWLAGLQRDGILGRDPAPAALVESALDVLWARRGAISGDATRCGATSGGRADGPVARTELAARLFGDAHALDDDRRLAAVVLRAGHHLAGIPEAANQREKWERLGILTDRVSTTCLSLGLRPAGAGAVDARVRAFREDGSVLHLTWRDLDEGLQFLRGQRVLVSENPRVVEAAAELGIDDLGFVTTAGRPSLVTLEVLTRLRAADAVLLYHGDFDWPGLSIANDLVHRVGVLPWRMSAEEYLDHPARLPLTGGHVEALWDPELAPAMRHRGLAVHEEAVLPELLHGLASSPEGVGR